MKRPVVALCLTAVLLSAAAFAAEQKARKLSVDEAVKLMQDAEAMYKSSAKRKAAAEAFKDLPQNQVEPALRKLLPLLAGVGGRGRQALRAAFLNLGDAAIPALVKSLGNDKQYSGALDVLPHFRERAVPLAVAAAQSADPKLRLRGVLLIELLAGSPAWLRGSKPILPAVSVLAKRLAEESPDIAAAAARALGHMGKSAGPAAPALTAALKSSREEVRVAAATTLGTAGPDAAGAYPALAALLNDRSAKARRAAANALARHGQSAAAAAETLGRLLLDAKADTATRVAAAEALVRVGQQDPTGTAATLVRSFADTNDAVALRAAAQAAGLGEGAVPELVKGLKSAASHRRRFSAFALAKMGTTAKAAAPDLAKALKDKQPLVRRNAAEALGRIGDASATGSLLPLLKDKHLDVALAAREAAASLAPQDGTVRAAIKALDARLAAADRSETDPSPGAVGKPAEYEIGGPLAGVRLPLFPTRHGEPAGHPGCIPTLAEMAVKQNPDQEYTPLNRPFTTVGQCPERQLYRGSVEHWRAYWLKYCPVRSCFDRQSQVKNWTAPNIPQKKGAGKIVKETFAAPINWVPRWGNHRDTGYKMEAVPVIRWGPGSAPFVLDCGRLQRGGYAVRIIAAAPREQVKFFRRDFFVRMKVNDGLRGEVSEYVKRSGYTEEFYSTCELFFHAPETRAYQIELAVGEGSKVDLMVHNISLDDCLAGAERRAIKTKTTMYENRARVAQIMEKRKNPKRRRAPLLAEERDLRDAWLWESLPAPNAQASRPYRYPKGVREGSDKTSPQEIAAAHGSWTGAMRLAQNRPFDPTPVDPAVLMVNSKLGLTWSIDDFRNNRPLPDPYPLKDNGTALTFPDPKNETAGAWFAPIGNVVRNFYWYYPSAFHATVEAWEKTGDDAYARDAALALVRWSYAFPLLYSQEAYLDTGIAEYTNCGRAFRFQRRGTTCRFYRWYTQYAMEELDDYDILFPFIEGNWDLAGAVGRFVPWVKTPKDVIKLIDTCLIQSTAKRILRYNWFTGEMKIARLATVLGDNAVTAPWMEWLFTKTYIYPLPISGLQDLMISGCTREGTEYVASTSYAGGENALPKAAALLGYIRAGGLPQYDLSDPARYPKPVATCYWMMERLVGGLNDIRIGDVCGPDKFYGRLFNGLDTASYWGWKWTKDPRFAFLRKHYFGRKDLTDGEWAEIEKSAATVTRAPWLDMPSRVMPQWAAVLESGRQHDDYRFRRAVMLRNGMGWGHHHNDGLDLQIYAHGVMMTCDGGQRPSYSKPGDRSTRMHNLVEVNGLAERGGEWLGHNWTRTLSDADGAKYVLCEAVPPKTHPNVKLYRRQTALIDAGEGKGSQKLTPEQCKPGAKLPENITSADSYVFDVVRVAGGKRHTYCFHANLSDEVKHNLENAVAIEEAPAKDLRYVGRMAGERLAGDAPEHLELTWRLEPRQVKADLRPNEPEPGAYCTRLHVLGEKGARVLRGSLNCVKWGYRIPMAFIQRRSDNEDDPQAAGTLESAFAAIIEPYVGKPIIEEIATLPVADNEADALRAVALTVRTAGGNTDICFADGRPEKTRRIQQDIAIAGEFACISTDADGLRQAALTGGTLLETPFVTLRPAAREYVGTVRKVDYLKKTMWIDQAWPAFDGRGRAFTFEVGTGNHWTCYTAVQVRPEKNATAITVQRGADYYLSRVKDIDEKTNTVYASLSFGSGREGIEATPGIDRDWVASNEEATKFWRAEYLSGDRSTNRFGFRLTGAPAKMSDFGRTKGFRLWEYGPGDTVRHSTSASIRRVEPGVFKLEADVGVIVALRGKSLAMSPDGKTWQALSVKPVSGKAQAVLPMQAMQAAGFVYLRVR